jgi:DNA polymerase sigma
MSHIDAYESRLHDEIVVYTFYINPTAQERAARDCLIAYVTRLIKRRFVTAEVHLFGSVAQDLCLLKG